MKPLAKLLALLLIGTYLAYRVIRFSAYVVGADSSTASTIGLLGAAGYIGIFAWSIRRGLRQRVVTLARDQPERLHAVAIVEKALVTRAPGKESSSLLLANLSEIAALARNVSSAGANVWIEVRSRIDSQEVVFPIEAMGANKLLAFFRTLPGFDSTSIDQAWAAKTEGRYVCWRQGDA